MKEQYSAPTAETAMRLAKQHANRSGLVRALSEKLDEFRRVELDLQQVVASFSRQVDLIDKIKPGTWIKLSRSRKTGHPAGWWQVVDFDEGSGLIQTNHPDYNVHLARVEAVTDEDPNG